MVLRAENSLSCYQVPMISCLNSSLAKIRSISSYRKICPSGTISLKSVSKPEDYSKRAKEVVAVGDCIIGDKNLLRFMNRRIVVESITDEFKEEAGHILIRPAILTKYSIVGWRIPPKDTARCIAEFSTRLVIMGKGMSSRMTFTRTKRALQKCW